MEKERPLVSWLIPTTLYHHQWWKRLIEFLYEDFPPELIECIFLGTQDKGFAAKAREIGEQIIKSLSFTPEIEKRWQNVRFIEQYSGKRFRMGWARNILTKAARGDIIIHRDADTALLKGGFTRFVVKNLLRTRVGFLGVPSLNNGKPFKPKQSLITKRDRRFSTLLLAVTVNGMATATLKSIEEYIGYRNEAIYGWGEHNSLSTKLARAGFLMGYADKDGWWLFTNDSEASISITDARRNPRTFEDRHIACAMINDFYNIKNDDVFWRIQRERYQVYDEKRPERIRRAVRERYPLYAKQQLLSPEKEKFKFKPWECLTHKETEKYLSGGRKKAEIFYQPLITRIKGLGLGQYLFRPSFPRRTSFVVSSIIKETDYEKNLNL